MLVGHHGKSNLTPMNFSGTNLYARFRRSALGVPLVCETGSAPPPERLLQHVWQHQRLVRDRLHLVDGSPVQVLHPGFWNHEAGPDFRGAVVQFGAGPARTGDIEIDLAPAQWHTHGHDRNPSYRDVLLHVVWEPGRSGDALPTLVLVDQLDASLADLAGWFGGEGTSVAAPSLAGQCCAPLRELAPERLADLLNQAACVRLAGKAAQMTARARTGGWEQALWEGLFRALGYKQNVWPMLRLAELLPQLVPAGGVVAPALLQARLLGVGGLLPLELTRRKLEQDAELRRIWDQWWRERAQFAALALPRDVWRFHGLRPANHPQRRLALATHWIGDRNFVARLERWFAAVSAGTGVGAGAGTGAGAGIDPATSLLAALQVMHDDFWSWHWTFQSARMAKPQPLLGAARVTDLAMNVLLPWLWGRAVADSDDARRDAVERLFLRWPAGEDNSVLRLARQRLLAGGGRRFPRTAAAQQGLLQIVRDFCEHSNALCTGCRFPELVRQIEPEVERGLQAAETPARSDRSE